MFLKIQIANRIIDDPYRAVNFWGVTLAKAEELASYLSLPNSSPCPMKPLEFPLNPSQESSNDYTGYPAGAVEKVEIGPVARNDIISLNFVAFPG